MKRISLIVLLLLSHNHYSFGQLPDATANFYYPEFKVTTTPEFPGMCEGKPVLVKCNEDFDVYTWINEAHDIKIVKIKDEENPDPHLSKALLPHPGEWCLTVEGEVEGVRCKKSINFTVYDLSETDQIKLYFENAGFYAIPIWRDEIININNERGVNRDNCNIQAIKLSEAGSSTDFVVNSVNNALSNFKPIQNFNSTAVFSTNRCLCDGTNNSLNNFEAEFKNGEASVWAHEFFTYNATSGFLFIKGQMSNEPSLPIASQKTHFVNSKLLERIMGNNATDEETFRIFTINLFLPHPIDGYANESLCSFDLSENETFATPALIPVNGNSNYIGYFARPENADGAMEGTLAWFKSKTRNTQTYQGFRFKEEFFEGYVDEVTGDLFEEFTEATSPGANFSVTKPIICEGSCKKSSFNLDKNSTQFSADGGLNFRIRNKGKKPEAGKENVIVNCIPSELTNDVQTISFISGTKGIVRLPCNGAGCPNILEFGLTYGAFTNLNNFNYKIVSGLLYRFKIIENNGQVVEYEYDITSKSYKSGKLIYENVPAIGDDDVVYALACGNDYALYKVGKGNLTDHSSSSASYYENFDAFAMEFRPFSNTFPLKAGPFIQQNDFNCLYCPSELTQIITEGYCGKPEHIYVDKIAQVATIFPEYFYDFIGVLNWKTPNIILNIGPPISNSWQDILANTPSLSLLYDLDKTEFFKIFLEKFIAYQKNLTDDFWTNIHLKTADQIWQHLAKEPQFIANSKPFTNKKLVGLNTLFNNGNFEDNYENAIIHLLAASNNSSDVEGALSFIEDKTINFIWTKFDNVGSGNDNLTRIMMLISSLCSKKYPDELADLFTDYYDNPNTMPSLEADLLQFKNLDFNLVDNFVWINQKVYDYYDILPISIEGTINIDKNTYQDGLVILMPAIQAAFFSHENDWKATEKLGWVALDVGLIFMGYGAVRGAFALSGMKAMAQGSIAVADITSSGISLALNLLNEDAIDKKTRQRWQMASLILGFANIGAIEINKFYPGPSGVEKAIEDGLVVAAEMKHEGISKGFLTLVDEADEIIKEAAKLDLTNHPQALNFILNNPNGIKAWETMISKSYRVDVSLLQRMSEDIIAEPTFYTWIKNNPFKLDYWKIWQTTYNSLGDPVKNVLGSGRINNTVEWDQLISEIQAAGGEIKYSPGRIAYSPGIKAGEPGQLIIDPDASITALRHEHRHFIDDQVAGYKGYLGLYDINFRYTTEYNAYKLEILAMKDLGQTDVVYQLKINFQDEITKITDDLSPYSGPPSQSSLNLVTDLLNL